MNCLSWNCRGLGSPRTVRALRDLVKEVKPSFIFLMETISFASKIEDLRVKLGYDHCFAVDRVNRSGGLAIIWKNMFSCEVTGYSQNHIDVVVSENNVVVWRMSCFYGFPERSRRKDSWALILRLAGLSPLPWCILGDFNDLMYPSDKKGAIPHPQNLLDGFYKTINECHLSELDLSGGSFTWEKSRGRSTWVRERLDRAFANANWWARFPLCNLKLLHTPVSDHNPILLEFLKLEISKRKFRFRFENMWLKEPGFVAEVSAVWKNLPPVHLLPKLFEVSSFMARWGRSFFHRFREKVQEYKGVMARLADMDEEDNIKEYLAAKECLNTLLYQEEIIGSKERNCFGLLMGMRIPSFSILLQLPGRKQIESTTCMMIMLSVFSVRRVCLILSILILLICLLAKLLNRRLRIFPAPGRLLLSKT